MPDIFTFSEAGGHQENEDAFDVGTHPADPECWICTLADGQGGQAGARRAARLACDMVMEAARRCSSEAILEPSTWTTLLRQADQAVAHDPQTGFTTLVGFTVARGIVSGASSGDSAVVVIGGNVRESQLSRRQQKNPPVGSGGALFIPFGAKLASPWAVLAMSDGVWKYVGWDRVVHVGTQLRGQGLIDSLQTLARLPGSGRFQDDFTLVVVQDGR